MGLLEKYVELPVGQLLHAPWNYKKTDGKKVELSKQRIRAALKKRGQIVNLIVREMDEGKFEVVNGNHRLDVFIEEKQQTAVCFNLGRVDQAQAEMIALETNELNVEADSLKLGALLKRVAEVTPLEEMTQTLPYEVPEIQSYIKAVDFSWQEFKEQQPPGDEETDDSPVDKNRQMVVLQLPTNLAAEFKAQLARFSTDAEAVSHCVGHLATLTP